VKSAARTRRTLARPPHATSPAYKPSPAASISASLSQTDRFVDLIKREDRKGIDEAITNAAVEKQVLERLRLKARTYGTDPSISAGEAEAAGKINVDAVVAMYKDYVIPLTKEVEVDYLMQRLKNTQWE
jgi:chorismate mutase